jgi:hypothetical protein
VQRAIVAAAVTAAALAVPLTYYGVRCPWGHTLGHPHRRPPAPACPIPGRVPSAPDQPGRVGEPVPPPLPAPVGFESRTSWPFDVERGSRPAPGKE